MYIDRQAALWSKQDIIPVHRNNWVIKYVKQSKQLSLCLFKNVHSPLKAIKVLWPFTIHNQYIRNAISWNEQTYKNRALLHPTFFSNTFDLFLSWKFGTLHNTVDNVTVSHASRSLESTDRFSINHGFDLRPRRLGQQRCFHIQVSVLLYRASLLSFIICEWGWLMTAQVEWKTDKRTRLLALEGQKQYKLHYSCCRAVFGD